MTRQLQMGDSAEPLAGYGALPVYAFYLFGETPHVWTDAEIHGLTARWGLPIAVNLDDTADYESHAHAIAARLTALGWTKGTAVAVDTEDTVQPRYLAGINSALAALGWPVMHYESKNAEPGNPQTAAGRWLARWGAPQVMPPDAVALQYANAQQNGTPWDASIISAAVRLHELNPLAVPRGRGTPVAAALPVLSRGQAGYAVRMLQGMLTAALSLAPDPAMEDGQFGPVTESHVVTWQHLYGIPDPAGTAGGETWASLLTRS